MRKKIVLPICLLLAVSTLSALTVNMVKVSAAVSPYIKVVPESTVTTDLTVGMLYTISVYTDYAGEDVWGYEFTLTYDPSVMEGLEVVNGDLITEDVWPYIMFTSAGFDNTAGELGLTGNGFYFLGVAPLTSGPGTLANITFRVVGLGSSDITLGLETKLIGYTEGGYGEMFYIIDGTNDPDHIGHGSFDNTGAPAYPPYPPVAAITGDADTYINEPIEFSGANSYDPDETAIASYEWDLGDGTTEVGEAVNHTYTTLGTYDVTLVVADEQNQFSDPACFTVETRERATWAADLSRKKAWPEHHHFDQSMELGRGEDLINTLYAKVQNIGLETLDVKVKFTIYDSKGTKLGTIETTEATLESLKITVLTAEFDTTIWGSPKYKVYLDTQCFYLQGTRWVAGETSKAFSIAVVP